MTSPQLPLVKVQRSFLSGIRLSRELHRPEVKGTAPPIKKMEVRNSRGFSFEVRKISLRFKLSRPFNVNLNSIFLCILIKLCIVQSLLMSNSFPNLIKIRSLACSPLLICHCLEDLKKPHYESYVNDHMSWLMTIINIVIRLIVLLILCKAAWITCSLFCNCSFHWLGHSVTRMWPVMGLP
jgi:hypothetical protein